MPSKTTVSQKTFLEGTYTRYSQYRKCDSNWVITNGKPNFRIQNPHNFVSNDLVVYRVNDPSGSLWDVYPGGVSNTIAPMTAPGYDWAKTEQIALAKFTGKLRKGHASLGVSLGSWGQSSDMIPTRLGQASRALTKVHARLVKDKKRLRAIRKERDPIANLVLETEFGWMPLFSDLHSAFGVLAGNSIPPCWITGRHKADQTFQVSSPRVTSGYGVETEETFGGVARKTIAATCYVSNPNAFLLNHLGLLNPLSVAWDLIPWSFVVGMFVNVQSMITSLTDEVGLTISDKSVTSSCKTSYEIHRQAVQWVSGKKIILGTGMKVIHHTYRNRTVGAIPSMQWQVRVPELNKAQMAIAASLVLQKFTRINRLLAF